MSLAMGGPDLNLAKLFNELLEIVLSNLDGKDVKNLALTCRDLKDICLADIFEHVTLMPFRQCLQGFASLFKRSPHLANLVHSTVYGELFVGLLESHYNKRREEGLEQAPSVLRAREDLVPRTDITDKDSDNEELELLREILRLLPNLNKEVYVEGLNDDSLTFDLIKACTPNTSSGSSTSQAWDRHGLKNSLTVKTFQLLPLFFPLCLKKDGSPGSFMGQASIPRFSPIFKTKE